MKLGAKRGCGRFGREWGGEGVNWDLEFGDTMTV